MATAQKEEVLRKRFGDLVRQGIFKPIDRFLVNNPEAEDRVAEGVASAWRVFRDCALQQGKELGPGALVQHAKWRACDLGRRLVCDGSRSKNEDAMSQYAYQRGRTQVLRLEGSAGVSELEDGLAKEMCGNPARRLNSALDLATWLSGLSRCDRQMLAWRFAGIGLKTLAKRFGVSPATVCRHLHQLGAKLADRAGLRISGKN